MCVSGTPRLLTVCQHRDAQGLAHSSNGLPVSTVRGMVLRCECVCTAGGGAHGGRLAGQVGLQHNMMYIQHSGSICSVSSISPSPLYNIYII
jgi:hypothetical protein